MSVTANRMRSLDVPDMADVMDVMDKMDILDPRKGDRYNNINIADKQELKKLDQGFSELPTSEGVDEQRLLTHEKTGDITTFDFDVFKYDHPNNYF